MFLDFSKAGFVTGFCLTEWERSIHLFVFAAANLRTSFVADKRTEIEDEEDSLDHL